MRSKSTPVGLKLLTLMVGFGLTGLLLILEIPLEGILAALLPFFGLAVDITIDGLEVLIAPLLIACCLLSLSIRQES